MHIPSHPNYVLRMLQSRLKKLATTSPVLAATFGQYTHRCGRPECRCHHGGPLHTGQHLTFKENGKTRSVYVPKDLLPEVLHMACRTQTPQDPAPRDPSTVGGPAPGPGSVAEAQGGATVIAGRALVQTVRHFFPQLNAWLNRLPDTRVPEACTYSTRFLAWWGLALYLLQLGSRRQLDYDLRDGGPRCWPTSTVWPRPSRRRCRSMTPWTTSWATCARGLGAAYARRWRKRPAAHEGPGCRTLVGPTGVADRCDRLALLPPAALSALPGATARPEDSLPPSGPGGQVVGAGRDGGVPGQ